MSLTCILDIYLRFKERKWCKLNHFRFWKIKKWLNKEISKSRLMDLKERQDENVMSLGDDKWPLWSKKEGKQTWKMRHEARFIKLHRNLELKILMALYTLTLMKNLEHFLESIIYILYIVLKLGKSGVQLFKWCAN